MRGLPDSLSSVDEIPNGNGNEKRPSKRPLHSLCRRDTQWEWKPSPSTSTAKLTILSTRYPMGMETKRESQLPIPPTPVDEIPNGNGNLMQYFSYPVFKPYVDEIPNGNGNVHPENEIDTIYVRRRDTQWEWKQPREAQTSCRPDSRRDTQWEWKHFQPGIVAEAMSRRRDTQWEWKPRRGLFVPDEPPLVDEIPNGNGNPVHA